MTRPLIKTAHDPGDSQITSHCPFCGSGQVIGRSDGNIECEFCGMTYLVRIQPMFTGMPQNPMGGGFGGPSSVATDLMSPGMVGPDGMPLDPGMADPMLAEEEAQGGQPFGDEEDVPPGEEVLEGGMPMGPATTEGGDEGFPPDEEGLAPDEPGDDEGDGGPGEADDESGDGPPWARGKSSPKDDDGSSGGNGDKKPSKNKGKDQKKSSPFKKKSVKRDDTPENRRHYNRGWAASGKRPTQRELAGGPSRLEQADDKGEPGAWYDGYMDYATERPKYHALQCPTTEHDQPGCSLYTEGRRRYRTVAGDLLPEDAYIRHLACLHGGVETLRRSAMMGVHPLSQHLRHEHGITQDEHGYMGSDIARLITVHTRDHARNQAAHEHEPGELDHEGNFAPENFDRSWEREPDASSNSYRIARRSA